MDKYDLITRNLQEVIEEKELKELLKKKKNPSVYWGTMPTGSVSIAYFFPMLKIADFLNAGLKVKILLADLHAALDSVPWEILEKRYEYYEELILTILKTIKVDVSKLEFVKGSELQLKEEYFHDLLKLSTFSTINASKKAASEVVKLGDNPKLSGIIYPLMQALDEEYLKVDMQFGGMDQRKIMVFAREYLPKIGYKKRIELLNPLIRGLVGEKMSSSIEATKIDTLDDEKTVKRKINKAECVTKDTNNGLMALLEYFIMILKQDRNEKLIIERPEKYGGNLEYSTYSEVKKDFISGNLHPLDLKNAVATEINLILKSFRENKKLIKLHKEAYQ
ncbi:tyrosine--tRNA ligase [archaeon]|jgi:tyrosyl-tRNA synthetase|nr:tyrosine--tRNA ligase [archaeon]MBT6824359.1 tyrosine--tRNA ligase [archaeon]MBT7106909.1 tyrosine--tRNA ligase [archaeon]MBT7297462.1 tyrosine--tRNA ligase [archaeon]